jgi:hypothetical protein
LCFSWNATCCSRLSHWVRETCTSWSCGDWWVGCRDAYDADFYSCWVCLVGWGGDGYRGVSYSSIYFLYLQMD